MDIRRAGYLLARRRVSPPQGDGAIPDFGGEARRREEGGHGFFNRVGAGERGGTGTLEAFGIGDKLIVAASRNKTES